ncbi:MAG: HEAT repeat domain-containing protein, partial [Planctomycetes bacterium]|nr:HEAT repeat domain-containing protein [Planctomycetota bacterium]
MAVLALLAGPAWLAAADEIYLNNGMMIEGVLLDDTGGNVLRLQTPSGVLGIPNGVVVRQVRGPTRWIRYEREKTRLPLSAGRHLELAQWCDAHDLADLAIEHRRLALEQDPTHPDALTAAGYVQVGRVWIKAISPPTPDELQRREAAGRARQDEIAETLVRGWQLQVRAVRDAYLKNAAAGRESGRSGFVEGRRRLLAWDDPLVLPGACRVLSDHEADSRLLLVELLAGSQTDTALLNLLALGLADDEQNVRIAAAEALATRADPRVSHQLRAALACTNDRLVRRTAQLLGWMRDRSAVPELIVALHAQPPSDDAPDLRDVFADAAAALADPIFVPIGRQGVTYPSG